MSSFQCPDHRLCVRPGAQDWVCLSLGARDRRLVLKVASDRCDPAASITQDPRLDPQDGRVQPWSRHPGGAQVPTCDSAPSGQQPPAAGLRDAEALSLPSHLGVSLSCPPHPNIPWPHCRCVSLPWELLPALVGGAALTIHTWGKGDTDAQGAGGPARLLVLPPAPSLFPSSELRFGMKGFDHSQSTHPLGDSRVPGRPLVPGTWREPW